MIRMMGAAHLTLAGRLGASHHETMRKSARFILRLSLASSATCLASGLAYLTVSPTELPVGVFVLSGVAGAAALVFVGARQQRETIHRRTALLTLLVLAIGFAVASVIGFVGAQVARDARLEPTALPSVLHAASVAIASMLALTVGLELLGQPRGEPRSGLA